MLSVQARDCPYCFNVLDPYADDPTHREGVQCGNCWTKYHKICWKRNDNCCMKCGHAMAYDVILPPLTQPMHLASPPPDNKPIARVFFEIRWRIVTMVTLVMLTVVIFILLYTR